MKKFKIFGSALLILGVAFAGCDLHLGDEDNRVNKPVTSNPGGGGGGSGGGSGDQQNDIIAQVSGDVAKDHTIKAKLSAENGVTMSYTLSASEWYHAVAETENAVFCACGMDTKTNGEWKGRMFWSMGTAYNSKVENDFAKANGAKVELRIKKDVGVAFYIDGQLGVFYKSDTKFKNDSSDIDTTLNDMIETFCKEAETQIKLAGAATLKDFTIKSGAQIVIPETPQSQGNFGAFICLDSEDGATSYKMVVDSIKVGETEKIQGGKTITKDQYINDYNTAKNNDDEAIKACAQEVKKGQTIVYTISEITVTGKTVPFWGVYNFGFTDLDTDAKYAVRCDGWDNGLAPLEKTGKWTVESDGFPSGGVTDSANVITKAPFECKKIMLSLKIEETQAVLSVFRVGVNNNSGDTVETTALATATWKF